MKKNLYELKTVKFHQSTQPSQSPFFQIWKTIKDVF